MTCIESIRTKEYVVTYERPREVDQHQLPKGAEEEIQKAIAPERGDSSVVDKKYTETDTERVCERSIGSERSHSHGATRRSDG